MKKLLFIAVLFVLLLSKISYAQTTGDTLTATFRVNGNPPCKANIEATVTAKAGVLSAEWDATSKDLTVTYVEATIPLRGIHSALAMAGYDTSLLRAKQYAYDALPTDCIYQRDPITE